MNDLSNTKLIPLTQGKFAIVDDHNFEWLRQWKWHAKEKGVKRKTFYACRDNGGRKNKERISMHRLIMNASSGTYVDHINHDGLDNRRENLRICSQSMNLANQRKQSGTSSRYKGVCFCKWTNRWMAYIKKNKKCFKLGRFDSEIEAALAYNAAAIKYFGEFACLNEVVV